MVNAKEPILEVEEWFRREENIYHGLVDLKPRVSTMGLDNDQLSYKHVKHEAGKVILGIEELSEASEIEVPT